MAEETSEMQHHPLNYLVTVSRRSHLMHSQMVHTREEAYSLASRYESMPGVEAEVTEVHDRSETDLTAHTRELIEGLEMSHFH